MDILIIYEDSDFVVVSKPAGLVVHSDGKTEEPTLADWILEHYPKLVKVGEPSTKNHQLKTGVRPGIVHRLDRETSGVLAIAKNQDAFLHLKEQFQNREVEKVYNAFVYGELKNDSGIIDLPIGKSRKDFRLRSAEYGARGELREAVTEYTALKRLNGFSFIEARPKTGRTHQIRAHFKAIQHPVVCDALYATKRPCALGFTRLALHARSLSFLDLSGRRIVAEAALPADFEHALVEMKKE